MTLCSRSTFQHFNTSNVTIQHTCTNEEKEATKISIHLMLLFNSVSSRRPATFSNISIHLMLLFNTTKNMKCRRWMYFNTSNVTIQHTPAFSQCSYSFHFNTSNVTIQLTVCAVTIFVAKFQYI